MADCKDLVTLLRVMACDSVQAHKPSGVYFGTVVSTSPLEIAIDPKHVLTEEFLVLSRNVTDFDVDMTMEHVTERAGGAVGPVNLIEHNHRYRGRKTFRVHNALRVGDEVIVLRAQGGQKHVVIDRVG